MTPAEIERLEESVLGLLVLEPQAIERAKELIKGPEFWLTLRARSIWEALMKLHAQGSTVESRLLYHELAKMGGFGIEKERGLVEHLMMQATVPANLETYCRLLTEQAMLRRLRLAAQTLGAATEEPDADPFELTERLGREVESVTSLAASNTTLPIAEAVSDAERIMLEITEHPEEARILHFGYADLDRAMGGMMKGNFIVIAGKDKSGKTTLSLQVVFYNVRGGTPFALFTPGDMTAGELCLRQAFIEAKVPLVKLLSEELSEEEVNRVTVAFAEMKKLPLYVNDRAYTIDDIVAEIGRLVREKHIGGAVVDYIQVVEASVRARRDESREREVAQVSRTLKRTAKRYGIVIIGQSQLNEEMRSRESRTIQQDADKLIFIDSHEDEPAGLGARKVVDLKIKQRLGASGTFGDVRLYWNGEIGTFENYSAMPPPPEGVPRRPREEPAEEEEADLTF